MVNIEVAYAMPEQQWLLAIGVAEGTTVAEAITQSGILQHIPHLTLNQLRVGIFSKPTTLDTVVVEGDRVEIYRPLQIDPKQKRKANAKMAKSSLNDRR